MALNSADIVFRHSNTLTDGTGGIASTTITSNAKNAIFPDVTSAQRRDGHKLGRKVWVHFAAPDGSTAADVKLCPFAPTAAGDCVVVRAVGATRSAEAWAETDTQRIYGLGTVAMPISSGQSALTVTAESAYAAGGFAEGDTILITDKSSPTASTGAEEYAVIDDLSVSGVTLTITTATALGNAYAAGARVAACLTVPSAAPAVTAGAVSSGATLDDSKITLATTSVAEDTWTATFSSATAYTLSGAMLGAAGSGTISTTFTGAGVAAGLRIAAGAFGGTLANGSTISFSTTAAAVPVWMIRHVPAGTGTFATNTATILVDCESA